MIERTEKTFGIKPDWLVADTAYGAAHNLHFLVDVKGIAPHIPVIDKSQRDDGTFSRDDFIYDEARDQYICRSGKILPRSSGARGPRGDDAISYFSRVADCRDCPLKSKCCPNPPSRKITRHVHGQRAMSPARSPRRLPTIRPDEIARRLRCCLRISSGFAARPPETAWAGRRAVRIYACSNRSEPSSLCQAGAPSTRHGRTMRCVSGVRRLGCVRHRGPGVLAAQPGRRPRDREPKFSDISPI